MATVSVSKKKKIFQIELNIFFILLSLCFIMPMLLVISASLMGKESIREIGYTFIPREFDFEAYNYIFKNPAQIISAYKVTFFISIVGTLLSTFVMALTAYPIARSNFRYRKQVTFFIFFTMLFGGGLVPTYIIVTQFLHLGNTIWVYIIPSLCSAWHIMIFRTFYYGIPFALIESAKIDGASETRIFFSIVMPLSKPVIATIALFTMLGKWNDWYTNLIYVSDNSLFTLQYLLQRILREANFIKEMMSTMPSGVPMTAVNKMPSDNIKYAMVIVTAGPALFVFPFFQKYFVKGLTIGAVKG